MSSESAARVFLEEQACVPDGPHFTTHSSLLWPVRRGEVALMVKVVDPEDDEAYAPEVLRYYDGDGAVRVVASDGPMQLLERIAVDPAVPTLEQRVLDGADDEATHLLCDVIDRLHRPRDCARPAHLIPFRSRSDVLRELLCRTGRLQRVHDVRSEAQPASVGR